MPSHLVCSYLLQIDFGRCFMGQPVPEENEIRGLVEARLLRSVDLVDLRFEAIGCLLEHTDAGTELVAGPDSLLIVHFPPQHLGEQVWQTNPGPPPPPPGASRHVASGPSRLVYEVSEGTRIRYTLADLLAALPTLPLRVADIATPAGESTDAGGPRPPTDFETAIEAPYHLVVSPSHRGAFVHTATSRGPASRSELWRTRLSVRAANGMLDEADTGQRVVRALWNRDSEQPPPDFYQPLMTSHRDAIVKQTNGGDPANASTPLMEIEAAGLWWGICPWWQDSAVAGVLPAPSRRLMASGPIMRIARVPRARLVPRCSLDFGCCSPGVQRLQPIELRGSTRGRSDHGNPDQRECRSQCHQCPRRCGGDRRGVGGHRC